MQTESKSRFTTEDLITKSFLLRSIEERIIELELKLLKSSLLEPVLAASAEIRELADRVARIDLESTFALSAIKCDYTRPQLRDDDGGDEEIEIVDGRHPVLEKIFKNPIEQEDEVFNNVNTLSYTHFFDVDKNNTSTSTSNTTLSTTSTSTCNTSTSSTISTSTSNTTSSTISTSTTTSNNTFTSPRHFTPNSLHLNRSKGKFLLLTGPNMGGKSTFLRQTALIVLMAQCGSFVPAALLKFTPVDSIFTRVKEEIFYQ